MVPFVAHLFPASWASVSILQGITEALATEDVATLCRNNETSILHNLENRETAFRSRLVLEQPEPQSPLLPVPKMTNERGGAGGCSRKEGWGPEN